MDRRQFLGTIGAVPLALTLNLDKVAEKKAQLLPTVKPTIKTKLIPEGWYNVTITNVEGFDHRYRVTFITENGYEIFANYSNKICS